MPLAPSPWPVGPGIHAALLAEQARELAQTVAPAKRVRNLQSSAYARSQDRMYQRAIQAEDARLGHAEVARWSSPHH
eukprot:14840651-Alexandrium_andersonii.AAC.3